MISIVIPLYNKEDSIQRTLASVQAQSVVDWELIVVDDGSRDDGPRKVSGFGDPRMRLVTQANSGVSSARNLGAELASSEVVCFLDADDYWAPDHLANLESLVVTFPSASLYATAYFVVGETGQTRKIRVRDDENGSDFVTMQDYFADVMEYEHPIHSSAVALNKRALRQIGGFPVGIVAGEDIITWARLACLGEVAYSKRATAYYVLPPVGEQRTRDTIRRPQHPDYVGENLQQLHRECPRLRPSLSRFIGSWHRIRAMLFMELNERINSITELVKAVTISGLRLRDLASVVLLALPSSTRAALLARWRQNFGRV